MGRVVEWILGTRGLQLTSTAVILYACVCNWLGFLHYTLFLAFTCTEALSIRAEKISWHPGVGDPVPVVSDPPLTCMDKLQVNIGSQYPAGGTYWRNPNQTLTGPEVDPSRRAEYSIVLTLEFSLFAAGVRMNAWTGQDPTTRRTRPRRSIPCLSLALRHH